MRKRDPKPTHQSIVAKSNDLIGEMAKFELSELRLIAYCLAHYDSRKGDNRSFTATIQDLVTIFPMDKKYAYDVVRKAMLGINKKPLELRQESKRYFWNWFSGFVYFEGEGKFEFKINPDIQPYLLELKGTFTKYRIADVYQFRSASTWKLYENLNQWWKTGALHVQLDELKTLLGVAEKYPRFNSFRQRLIDPAVKEINDKSDLIVDYEKEIKSRKVVALKFFIDKKQPEEIINIDSPRDTVYKLLLQCRINDKSAQNCLKKICIANQEQHFIKLIPKIRDRWNSNKGALQKYMLGSINQELTQLKLFTEPEEPKKPDYAESLDCWQAKRRNNELCKVRQRGKAGNRKKCQICLETLKVETFGV